MNFPEEFLELIMYFVRLKRFFQNSRYSQKLAALDSRFGCFYRFHQSARQSEWDTCKSKSELF